MDGLSIISMLIWQCIRIVKTVKLPIQRKNSGTWQSLITDCDDSVFALADETELRQHLIEGKVAGDSDSKAVWQLYEQSDRHNIV